MILNYANTDLILNINKKQKWIVIVPLNLEGLIKTDFYQSAKNILWMSEKQKSITIEKNPKIKQLFNGEHHIQSSTFDFDTLDKLKRLKETTKKNDKFAILGSGSWIKGIQETEQYCLDNKINYEKIPNLPYSEFIKKLAEYKGFVFMPLDLIHVQEL